MAANKIVDIQVCELQPPPPSEEGTPARRSPWGHTFVEANPLDRFDQPVHRRSPGGLVWVKVIADDGTWGLGLADTGHVATILINECLAPLVIGQEVGAIDLCNDLMWRGTLSFGNEGLTARAVAGVDLALWDLWGKILDQPVYRLAGGPARRSMEVYVTGNDVDWSMELGFKKFKLARPYGVYDGQAGIDGTVELIAKTRELIGPEADLMLDCWMAYDADYAVQMCEALRPYRMRWMEEMLVPHDWKGLKAIRQRVPMADACYRRALGNTLAWDARGGGKPNRPRSSRPPLDWWFYRGDETGPLCRCSRYSNVSAHWCQQSLWTALDRRYAQYTVD